MLSSRLKKAKKVIQKAETPKIAHSSVLNSAIKVPFWEQKIVIFYLRRSEVSATAGKLVVFIFNDLRTIEYGQNTQNKTPKEKTVWHTVDKKLWTKLMIYHEQGLEPLLISSTRLLK